MYRCFLYFSICKKYLESLPLICLISQFFELIELIFNPLVGVSKNGDSTVHALKCLS